MRKGADEVGEGTLRRVVTICGALHSAARTLCMQCSDALQQGAGHRE